MIEKGGGKKTKQQQQIINCLINKGEKTQQPCIV
jgi:hypothetical protein